MSLKYAYSLTEAQGMLDLCKTALHDLISGQAQSYRIGTREFTALDVGELEKLIQKYSDMVEVLSGKARSTQVARAVPRDL